MAALSGLRERQETTRPTSRCSLERSGFATQNNSATCSVAMLRSCSSCCCGAVTGGAAVLQAATLRRCNYQQHCNAQRCAAARVAAALRRYTGCCDVAAARGVTSCGAAARVVAMLRRGSRSRCYKLRRCSSWGAVTLRRCSSSRCCDAAALRRYGAATARGAATLWHCSSCGCCFFFFLK